MAGLASAFAIHALSMGLGLFLVGKAAATRRAVAVPEAAPDEA